MLESRSGLDAMITENEANTVTLESTSHIPIAQLTPQLAAPSARSLKAVVTLTWPYSSATGAIAFLLAEPDFRLRRTRGQVRVQFSGSTAKAVAKAGIASGDEVILSLDGVEFIQGEASPSTPGRGVEFELKFTERLHLQFQQEGAQSTEAIDIDPSISDPALVTPPRETSPQADVPLSPQIVVKPDTPLRIQLAPDEYSSPAFTKRARISYGSLFESELESDDGTIKGRGRKKTRLSTSWRYSSRSPTPDDLEESSPLGSPKPVTQPPMTDDGVQTTRFREDAAEALAELARPSTDVGGDRYAYTNGTVLPDDAVRLDTGKDTFQTSSAQDNAKPQGQSPHLQSQSVLSEDISTFSSLVSPHAASLKEQSQNTSIFAGGNESFEESITETNSHNRLEADRDDIYNASPIGNHGKSSYPAMLESQDSIVGDDIRRVNYNDEYSHENENIHEQSPGVQTEGGPHISSVDVMQHDHHHAQDHESSQPEDFGQLLGTQNPFHTSQYPDLDDGAPNNQLAPSWGQDSGPFTYPEIVDHGDHIDAFVRPLSQPHSTIMSRSTSSHSAGADPAGNSTERDFRERGNSNDIDRPEILPAGYSNAGFQSGERGFVGYHGVDEEHIAGVVRHPDRKQDVASQSEDGDYSSEEDSSHDRNLYPSLPEQESDMEERDESEEDEVDEHGHIYQQRYYKPGKGDDEAGSFDEADEEEDEGEGSYDEELEEEEDEDEEEEEELANTHPTRQNPPVVIDLLSSDDEEEEVPEEEEPEEEEPEEEESEEEPVLTHQKERHTSQQVSSQASRASSEDASEGGSESDEAVNDETFEDRADALSEEAPDSSPVVSHQEPQIAETQSPEFVKNKINDNHGEQTDYLPIIPNEASADSISDIPMEDVLSANEPGKQPIAHEQLQDDDLATRATPQPQPEDSTHESYQLEITSPKKVTVVPLSGPDLAESQNQGSLFGRLPVVDGTNDESEHGAPIENKQPTIATTEASTLPAENELRKETKPRQSLFARMFNIDGANDESEDESRSEIAEPPPPDIAQTSSTLVEGLQPSKNVEIQSQEATNRQLLTPETTQLSGSFLSRQSTGIPALAQKATTQSDEILHTESLLPPDTEHVIHDSSAVHQNAIHETSDPTTAPEISASEVDSSDRPDRQVVPVVASKDREQTHENTETGSPVFTAENPRRSHRRVKSTTISEEIKERSPPVTPVTPVKPKEATDNGTKNQASSKLTTHEQPSPDSHDASIELALSSLESPSKHHDLRRPLTTDLKVKLNKHLRTDLEEFTALKVLRYHLNHKLDVLAIATTAPPEPQRAKSGPRHYLITFNITDPSIAPNGVSEVQIFRPYKEALPIFKPGDGILLRSFQVVSVKNRGFALRSDAESSSWAVFGESDEVEVRGPPVEYGDGERNHIALMKEWFNTLDPTSLAKLSRANTDKAATA